MTALAILAIKGFSREALFNRMFALALADITAAMELVRFVPACGHVA